MIVGKTLKIEIPELTTKQWRKLEKDLTYQSGNGDIVISYRRMLTKGQYELPRGAWFLLPDSITYVDERTKPSMPELNFILELDAVAKDTRFAKQSDAVEVMFRQEQGIVVRPPGTGKTQIATAFAAKCKTRTLVLVHTEDILNQWVESVEKAIPELKGEVGVIRGKTCKIGHITIATVQTLHRSYLGKGKKWWEQWGCLIADEGHHVAAPTWEAVINACPAYYRFAFTASPTRADGMHPSMRFIVGPVIHRMKFTSSVKLEVRIVRTKFHMMYRGHHDWGKLLRALISDPDRNKLIARVADREIKKGNSVLILSRRIEQLEAIRKAMASETEILTGSRKKGDRQQILADFREGKVSCLLATQLADEALDVQRLNRVLLVHPGKHEGRIVQQIGRALRTHEDKDDAVIYDFVDRRVSVLRKQANFRKRTYNANDIKVRPMKRRKLGD